ncbi:M20 family metallopeptidase [Halalkalicoccus jeotgali]|uniref:Succinyl-diaminopimelate desuccinylase n=1 Tax=Halalkalicoccus jeotgali (strain DSM 18796 / CECT 7217 / JCM 14584 / KCTC 4019 / B3) TaxID=795797 RepID=D8J894_HALJB|nr:M20 family metallopeptidase [Halalkalicoccus jeotgali]ADJ16140.1 succinyl-diaminopimelate desuccinylase [Halalkalicoccus jeotgali B3]ELY37569.1 succinyl-diaminopimelate desuccinylase [Halalkalicoccus jeotgali B3]
MSFDPIAFLERAVQIPSDENVSAMREFLCTTLRDHGVEPEIDEAGNVIASRGDGALHTLLNTHIDTVSPHVPFERDGETIRGRGSCDAKGPLSAMLAAFLESDPDGTLTLAITPDEETLSMGAHHLSLEFDRCIVGEPTDLDVCTAAKGRFQGTLTVRGESAHAAEPETGTNAISEAGRALVALESFDADANPHPELGGPTLTPTVIEGGTATNQVPAACRITLDRRSVPPETTEAFAAALAAHLDSHVPGLDAEFRFTDRETPFLEAFETDPDSPIVEALRAAGAGEVRPFTAATEASYFASEAPTVVFGPGVLADETGAVAHGEREYVRVERVRRAATILTEALSG